MIKKEGNKTVLEFGDGDLYSISLSCDEYYGLGFYNGKKGDVGRKIKKLGSAKALITFLKDVKVIFKFNNIESLEATIKNLTVLRDGWIEKKQEPTE